MKFRTLLLGVSALLVAACAAYFSVLGLSKLFAGESLLVIIMAGSLELAKLVSAGFIYNYWEKLNKLLKGYLTTAVVILMLITSVGIYGFLTSAYKETSDQLDIIDKQTEVIELKKNRYSEELANYNDERNQLNNSIGELSKGLANNVIQYKDSTGQLITTTSSATRRALQEQLNDFKSQRDNVTGKIDVLNDSITSLDLQVLDLISNNEVAAEIGPLRYISDITGKDMDTVVNWMALFIVLVFDPLAVTLIIAFNAAMKIDKGERDKKRVEESYKVYGEKKDDLPKPVVDDAFFEDDMEELEESIRKNKTVNEVDEEPSTPNTDILQSERDKEIFFKELENPSEPNETLKDAFKKYMAEKNNLPNVDNPKWIEYENGGWKNRYKENEFFYHPWFDWRKADRWIHNKHAIDYWLKYQGGSLKQLQQYKDMYPDADTTTIY
jgi:hypothetical protein